MFSFPAFTLVSIPYRIPSNHSLPNDCFPPRVAFPSNLHAPLHLHLFASSPAGISSSTHTEDGTLLLSSNGETGKEIAVSGYGVVSETATSGNALVAEFLPFSGSVDVGAIAIDSACSSFDTAESAFKGVSVKSRAVVTLAIQREDDHWTLRVSRDQNVLATTSVRGKWIFPAVRYQVSQPPPISSPLVAFSSLLVAPTSLFPLHLLRPSPVPVAFPLSFRRPITFTDPLFTSSDFSILPAGKAFSLGVLTVRLHTDGLRGFGFAVPPIPATVSKFPPFGFYDFENGGFVGGAAIRGAFPQIQGNTDVTITLDCELGYARFIMNDVLAVDVFECTDV